MYSKRFIYEVSLENEVYSVVTTPIVVHIPGHYTESCIINRFFILSIPAASFVNSQIDFRYCQIIYNIYRVLCS